jgi:hypothetical protein
MFKRNVYHEKKFNMAVSKERRVPQNRSNDNGEGGRNINLPYIKETTEKNANILRKGNIKISFSPLDTLRKMLEHAKDSLNHRLQSGVYAIPCSCGKQYIGETKRTLQFRIKENYTDIRHN